MENYTSLQDFSDSVSPRGKSPSLLENQASPGNLPHSFTFIKKCEIAFVNVRLINIIVESFLKVGLMCWSQAVAHLSYTEWPVFLFTFLAMKNSPVLHTANYVVSTEYILYTGRIKKFIYSMVKLMCS